jgi:hypothetical protein
MWKHVRRDCILLLWWVLALVCVHSDSVVRMINFTLDYLSLLRFGIVASYEGDEHAVRCSPSLESALTFMTADVRSGILPFLLDDRHFLVLPCYLPILSRPHGSLL